MEDSLKIVKNKDGSFTIEWDKEDFKWKFLNDMTSKEIQEFVQKAINHYKQGE